MDPSPPSHNKPTLFERLSLLLLREPEDSEQLLQLLRSAHERNLMDADALSIIEGALAVSEMQVRDIMVPRAQMDVISVAEPPERLVDFVLETAHSRFPAFGDSKDDVIGILLAKTCCAISPARSSTCVTACGRQYSSRNRSASMCCCGNSGLHTITWRSSSMNMAASPAW
jgi:Mg2+/Co2+ transporter CorC